MDRDDAYGGTVVTIGDRVHELVVSHEPGIRCVGADAGRGAGDGAVRALRVIDDRQSMLVLVGLIRKDVDFAEQSLSGGDLVLTRRRERVLDDDCYGAGVRTALPIGDVVCERVLAKEVTGGTVQA